MLTVLFVVQSCAMMMPNLTQNVPVTSNPVGAAISVDGKAVGQSPLILTLTKKRSHTVRIEMAGYDPTELRVGRKLTVWAGLEALAIPVAAMGVGFVVFLARLVSTEGDKSWDSYDKTFTTIFWVTCAAGTAGWIAELSSGANLSLAPRTLDVTLTKTLGAGVPRLNVIQLDPEQLKDIRWIRIHPAADR
jgi:PEGA domain